MPWSSSISQYWTGNDILSFLYCLVSASASPGVGPYVAQPYVQLNTTTGLLTVTPAFRNTVYNITVAGTGTDGYGNNIGGGDIYIIVTETTL